MKREVYLVGKTHIAYWTTDRYEKVEPVSTMTISKRDTERHVNGNLVTKSVHEAVFNLLKAMES